MPENPIEQGVRLFYTHSSYGAHTMLRPTRAWTGVPWQDAGVFEAWDTTPVNAVTMITAFVDLLLPLFKPAVAFTGYEILQGDGVSSETLIPVFAGNFTGKVGTSEDDSQDRAWERTYLFRTTGSWLAKICLLDTPCQGLVSRYNTLAPGTPDIALVTAFMAETNAWDSRASQRPVYFYGLTTQPNKALERKYGIN